MAGARGATLALGLLVVLAACRGPAPADALRVLGLFPLPAHSHFLMFKALAEGLVESGHEVVLFSPFPNKKAVANWTDIDTSGGRPSLISTFTFDMVSTSAWSLPGMEMYKALMIIKERAGNSLCRQVFSMPAFDKLMRGGYGRFDVVLTEVFASDCWAAVPHKLGLPVVTVSSAPDVSWMHERIGSVDNPAYINNVFTDLSGPMTLWQRFCNTASTLWINYLFKAHLQDASDEVVREFFGPGVPPLHQLVKNTSLILLNRHVSIHAARPVVPNLVHVGGLHIKAPPGKLDSSLRAWMDEAQHGVVFFSLGSLIRAATMPAAMRDALLAAFAKLPQRVLWKWEDDGLQVPANVRVAKWLPQMDILTHPKTVLFITHGGLMGTLESLHSSVPMLGIPLFADQMSNIELYMSLGIAEKMDSALMTADYVHAKIHGMVSNPRYLQRAKEVARLFRDRPRAAMAEAVWWIEYVVRNRGAKHLRPLGADMPLYQYLLLDVVALALAMVAAAVLAVVWAARRLLGGAKADKAPKHKRS
ncbi:UDP-glucuronosyltransferase 2B15-like isoform X2 [Thrips palmi]|nr:UDP-glucuronosyltransferase 2B15-like isoform X2 [Thrips palmi]